MSDLRTRIAYAIAQADGDLPSMEPDTWDYKLADAVIRELKLERESPQLCDGGGNRHRYVTDWEDDDE
jgi:hypothetical protein